MGQEILGNIGVNEVTLLKRSDGIGDSLSVHLTQQARSTARWTIEVWVHIDQGTFFLGRIVTPVLTNASIRSRTVAIANCPAATGWVVRAFCDTQDELAELALDSSKCCSSVPGVEAIEPDGNATHVIIDGPFPLRTTNENPPGDPVNVTVVDPIPFEENPWDNAFSTGSGTLTNSFVISAVPGILRSITVRIDAALASGTYYLQLWNLVVLPADGALGTDTNWLASAEKVVHVLGTDNTVIYNFNEGGVEFDTGAVLGLSSTAASKTNVAGSNLSVTSAEYRST